MLLIRNLAFNQERQDLPCNRAVHPPIRSRGLDSVQTTGEKAACLHDATSAFTKNVIVRSNVLEITLLFGPTYSSTCTITQKVQERVLRVRVLSTITPSLEYMCRDNNRQSHCSTIISNIGRSVQKSGGDDSTRKANNNQKSKTRIKTQLIPDIQGMKSRATSIR